MDSMAFAKEWIESWNSHDLDAIVSHYSDNIEFKSPIVQKLLNEPSGLIKGKSNLKAYFKTGLEAYPDLGFERWWNMIKVYGVESLLRR